MAKPRVELEQGQDEKGRTFGYVHGKEGGYFFTWMPTLVDTLESLEEDETDGNGGLDENDVASYLSGYLPKTDRGKKLWKRQISISRDGVWSGDGTVDADGQIECSAVLGDDQDASDETYEAISDAIEEGNTSGEVERPDGTYTWTIS